MLSVVAILAAVAIVLAVKGIKIVQHSKIIIVERLGKYHSTLESGINIICRLSINRGHRLRSTLGATTTVSGRRHRDRPARRSMTSSQSVITAHVQIMINAVPLQITDLVSGL